MGHAVTPSRCHAVMKEPGHAVTESPIPADSCRLYLALGQPGPPAASLISRLLPSADYPYWVRVFLVEPKSCFHAGDFVARRGAIASICRRPASLDLGLVFRWPIGRARRQMRGDRIKCLGLRTDRTSCMNATDSICRRARMESQSGVKLGQWARGDDKSNRSRSVCGNATCGTF